MSTSTIYALLRKEYLLLIRNRMFMVISLLMLFILIAGYFLLPADISNEPQIAVYSEINASSFYQTWDEEAKALEYKKIDSAVELRKNVSEGEYAAGLIITEDLWKDMIKGNGVDVPVIISPGLAEEYIDSITIVLDVVVSAMSDRSQERILLIETEETVLGEDIMSTNIPLKRMMVPLMVSLLIIMEMLALGISLIDEKENGSIKAVLVAPVRMGEILTAKGIAGITAVFIQVIVLMHVTGSLKSQLPAILFTLLMGAVFTVGISALIAAYSRDVMSLISKGIFVLLLLGIPSFSALFRGMLSDWMRFIPSFILVDTLNHFINRGTSWREIIPQIGTLYIFCIAFFIIGVTVFRRDLKCQ